MKNIEDFLADIANDVLEHRGQKYELVDKQEMKGRPTYIGVHKGSSVYDIQRDING